MVSINRSKAFSHSETNIQKSAPSAHARHGKQGRSLARLGVAALAATSLMGQASAVASFSGLPFAGSHKGMGGVKPLPKTLQPGQATLALLGQRSTTVTAPLALTHNLGAWYGVSAPRGAALQSQGYHPGRRMLGLTPFGGGGDGPAASPTTSPGATPPTNSCNSPASPQAAAASSGALVSSQLKGCPLSDYSAPISVGGQDSSAIADTGSGTVGMSGNTCSNCGTPSSYKPGSNAKDDGYQVKGVYGKGEWDGEVYTVDVSYGGGPTGDMRIGVIESQSDWFAGNECDLTAQKAGPIINDGLVGLGMPDLAVSGTDSWFEKVNSTLPYAAITFGLCDLNGGMFLGGYPKNNVASDLVLTPMVPPSDSPYVAVPLEAMAVGGKDIGATLNDFGFAIMDTGSTALYFPPPVYQAITAGISAATKGAITRDFFDTGDCVNLESTTISDLDAQAPPLKFSFYNAANSSTVNTVTTTASNSYLLAQNDGNGGLVVCPVMVNSGEKNPMTLLGNTMMRNFLTVFDYSQYQVGFALSQGICQST